MLKWETRADGTIWAKAPNGVDLELVEENLGWRYPGPRYRRDRAGDYWGFAVLGYRGGAFKGTIVLPKPTAGTAKKHAKGWAR